jgi:hypothetical protein
METGNEPEIEVEIGGAEEVDFPTTGYDEEEDSAPAPAPVLLEVRRPEPFPADDAACMNRLRIQASNILENMKAMRGIRTYKTTWDEYVRWHKRATGQDVPRCPLTNLIWLDVRQGTYFVTDMAATGKTIDQMSSARSALNWLIGQYHTLRLMINTDLPAPAKLSSKDSVSSVGIG